MINNNKRSVTRKERIRVNFAPLAKSLLRQSESGHLSIFSVFSRVETAARVLSNAAGNDGSTFETA